jgi:hypothetical protein
MAQTLQHGEGDIRRRQLVGEALADQAGELGLMAEGVHAGNHAAGAVAKQKTGNPGFLAFAISSKVSKSSM